MNTNLPSDAKHSVQARFPFLPGASHPGQLSRTEQLTYYVPVLILLRKNEIRRILYISLSHETE
jgi:hypothetical protein